ncbi:uncharacterized protein K444DRAFT_663657 [Hyaloscypha bicolor E]|uniref:Uncharacterized protein n=1 Tax=Hyaloscypha bicolor E TaxID=1095630 RepID=A0A2J6T962_9HELO|nr:uncharacterized protein K444DRAFT_663657 [Hyaloscypha bicolor E]PMD59569.1 hypothetical protein K444DRAFT_663657 [Hyaloscypha bicolor E]
MRFNFYFLSLAACSSASIFQKRGCNADNCARAVTGTRYAPDVQASHMADCTSFFIKTITPATPTSTVYITPTSYSVVGSNAKRTAGALAKKEDVQARGVALDDLLLPAAPATTTAAGVKARQVTQLPNQVPIYASACAGTARYSSACSCAGVTMSTTYAPTPATTTTTLYAPPSIIPVCDPADNYGYRYLGGSIEAGVGLVRTTSSLNRPLHHCVTHPSNHTLEPPTEMSQMDKQAKYKGEACEELLESPDRMARKLAMEVSDTELLRSQDH